MCKFIQDFFKLLNIPIIYGRNQWNPLKILFIMFIIENHAVHIFDKQVIWIESINSLGIRMYTGKQNSWWFLNTTSKIKKQCH